MAVVFALLAAVSYGIGDFIGGLGGRRAPAALIPIFLQAVGVIVASAAILGGFSGPVTLSVLAWGAIGGIGSGVGNAALLRGLADGRMSVVAPVSAVVTAALPAITGLVTGDRLTVIGWLGIVVALPAVALTSLSDTPGSVDVTDIGYGLVAGLGFGFLFIAMDRAGTDAGAWPLLPAQIVALAVVTIVAAPELSRMRRGREPLRLLVAARWGGAAGALGAVATLAFLAASGHGQLTVVAVLTGLYPAVTVLLAAVVLRERIRPLQLVGLAACAVAVALIVTGV